MAQGACSGGIRLYNDGKGCLYVKQQQQQQQQQQHYYMLKDFISGNILVVHPFAKWIGMCDQDGDQHSWSGADDFAPPGQTNAISQLVNLHVLSYMLTDFQRCMTH
eukprot:655660-Amphidinium_carterae.1